MGNKKRPLTFLHKDEKDVKIKYSLSLKLTLIVVFLSIIIIFTLSIINIYMQSNSEKQLLERTSRKAVVDFAESHAIIKSIEDYLTNFEKFNDSKKGSEISLFLFFKSTIFISNQQ